MQLKTILVVLALAALPLGAAAQTIIPNSTTYSAGRPPVVVSGSSTLATSSSSSTTNPVIVSSGATVTYQASTSIKLEPGFHASAGGHFFAMIGSTFDTDGDGLPDVWERAHGLNPNYAPDAQYTTSGGLTYLLEYQLGTTITNSKQTDSSNQTKLNVHVPRNP
jgi:hypothetical protein